MSSNTEQNNGLIHLKSPYSVVETIARIESALKERGLRLFTRIDHTAAAAEVGLKMRPTQVLLFGNPVGGTPMMVVAPTLAIDLPFRALIWEDATGQIGVPAATVRKFTVAYCAHRRPRSPETQLIALPQVVGCISASHPLG